MGFIESLIGGIVTYKWVILFYAFIILLIILNRKKFEFEAKIIAMYRTKIGIKFIDRIGEKYSEFLKILGYVGIGVGYIGMFIILFMVVKGMFDLFLTPNAAPVLAPVLPGVKIPGIGITVPLIEGLIALFIVVTIHEAAHGIIARAHKIPIRSTGVFFLGPLIGAFVEPDDKKLIKANDEVKYSVYAAGPFSNIILALLIALVMGLLFVHPTGENWDVYLPKGMTAENGVMFHHVIDGSPAAEFGFKENITYNELNSIPFKNYEEFSALLNRMRPNETGTITDVTGNEIVFVAGENDAYKQLGSYGVGYLGVQKIVTVTEPKAKTQGYISAFVISTWIGKLLFWIYALSFGLGLANLLPIGPVDGGQMIRLSLGKIFGEKEGKKAWIRIAILMIAIIILSLFMTLIFPILKSAFS